MSTPINISSEPAQLIEAFTAANLGWWEYDPVHNAATWSPRCKELFGLFSDKALTYADWAGAVHPEDFHRADDGVYRALQTTGFYDEEYRTVGIEDGKLRWLRSIARVQYDGEGRPVKMVGVLIETSSPKVAEAIAQEGDNRLKVMADTLPQLVWVTGPDGYHEFFNRRWYEYTGLTFEQTRGEGWAQVLHPDDGQRAWEAWHHSLRTGEAYAIEYRFRRHDGEYRWFLTRALPLRNDSGTIIKWFGTSTDIHEGKLLYQQLQESRDQLNLLANAMPQVVWIAEGDGRVVYYNDRVAQFSGTERLPDGTWRWEGVVHPDDQAATIKAWSEAVAQHVPYETEHRIRMTDGTYRWYLSRGFPQLDAHGGVIKWFGSATDIHEQKSVEEALRYSHERFELVSKATQDAIWDWDLTTDSLWWNEGFKVLFGYRNEEIEPTIESWYSRIHPADKQWVIDEVHAVIGKGGSNWAGEYRFRRRDGSYAVVFDRAYALHDATGKPYRLLGSMQDITEKKKVEATLVESERRFRTLAQNSPDIIARHGRDFKYLYASPSIETMTGLKPDELEGKSYWDVGLPTTLCRLFDQQLARVFATGTLQQVEYTTLGEEQSYLFSRLVPEFSKEGQLTSVLVLTTDITERKKAEALLEQRVRERTAELEQRNRELEQFTFISHHDLQEPLRKIIIFSDMIRAEAREKLSDTAQSRLDRVMNAARRMSDILKDVMNYASLSKEEAFVPVDLEEVVAQVQTDLEILVHEKSAVIRCDALPTLRAVPAQMHQLFYNLLNNALKFARPGVAPVTTVHCRRLEATELPPLEGLEPQPYYEVSVQDNGIGFAPAHASRIFQMFQRLHSKDEFPGTGIGLALCEKVVTNHGGRIWAEAAEGEGARFVILLPAGRVYNAQ